MAKHTFTLGIEEEFQILDPETGALRSHMHQIMEGGQKVLKEQVKAEMHASMVEVGTGICNNIHEAREEVTHLRRVLADVAMQNGLRIGSSGTHPFSLWQDQLITDHPRYAQIVNEMKEVARGNLIFGLHVHVGIPNREVGIHLMNAARYFLPHIYALSTNSPFWETRNTGFKSFRSKIFDRFPRTGIPDAFDSAAQYDGYIDTLIKTNCIDNGKKIWWDIRLHPFFQTVEWRVCDVQMRADETIAIAALIQAIMAKLYKLMQSNLTFRHYSRALINENKWRASRYGIEGSMIDFGKQTEVPTKLLIHELIAFVEDVIDELDSRDEIANVFKILDMGTGADRQLQVYNQAGGDLNSQHALKAVMDYIVAETHVGL